MIRSALALGIAALLSGAHPPVAHAANVPDAAEVRMRDCLTAAAAAHRVPPAMLVILLKVEDGTLGHVSRNTNGTVDIGPMQVNTVWVPRIAAHWSAAPASAFLALRDNLCANLEGGAWILRQAMDEARGDFWGGVGIYHSHNPDYKARYLRKVLDASLQLQAQARKLSDAAGASEASKAAVLPHLEVRN